MALNKEKLKGDIKKAFEEPMNKRYNNNRNGALDKLGELLAEAITKAIKDIGITYTTGLSTLPGGGAVTGTFEYKIN